MALRNCNSCGRQTKDYVCLKCPNCGESEIVRCQSCRENLNPYVCGRCGNQGP